MSATAKLKLIYDDGFPEINVFIHGYRAIGSQSEYETLCTQIAMSGIKGKIYILFWKSGSWKFSKIQALALLRHLKDLRHIKNINPWAIAGEVGIFAATEIYHFKRMQSRAENLGMNLKTRLMRISKRYDMPINLIGHSLGARAIHYALAYNDLSNLYIKDCYFLGGAASATDQDWEECYDKTHGRFFCGYSKSDKVISLLGESVTFDSLIGRHGIPWEDQDVVNIEFKGFGHSCYWNNLEKAFKIFKK